MKRLNVFWKIVFVVFTIAACILAYSYASDLYRRHWGVYESNRIFNPRFTQTLYFNKKCALFRAETQERTTPKLDWITTPGKTDTLIVFGLNGKRGYIDASIGKIVFPAQYEHAWAFSEGVGAVVMNNKLGFIDKNQQMVIPFKFTYSDAHDKIFDYVFRGGYATVLDANAKAGIINKKGEWVVRAKFDYINKPEAGYRIVKLNRKYGILDKNLKMIVPVEYDNIEIQKEGFRVAKNGEQQLITFDTKTVLKAFVYDEIASLQYGSGRMDSTGTEIMINTNCFAYNIFTKWGLMKRDGTVLTKAIYDEVEGLGKDLFVCTIENYKFTINEKGKILH